MRADLIDGSVIHDNNLIGIFNRGNALRNDNLVVSGKQFFSPFLIKASVFVSTALVESSKIKIFGF